MIASYDYDALIDERSAAMADYCRFLAQIAAHLPHRLPEPPPAPSATGSLP